MSGNVERIGPYEVRGVLGRGGTATVYRAYDAQLGREVALKVLTAQEGQSPAVRERFRREAQTVARLRHPHIITLHSFGEDQGRPYIVTELFTGGPLSRQLGHPLPLQEVASIVRQIGAALDFAHDQGLVHRDVKPANIFLDGQRAVLADFGLVKVVAGDGPQLTQTGVGMGTPEYIAPEQALGQRVDGRADLYALGVVLYEMLTGAPPFVGQAMEVLSQHVNSLPPDVRQRNPALPVGTSAVVQKTLARHPQDRYASGTALADALDVAITGGRTTAPGQLPGLPDRGARTMLVSRAPERLSDTQLNALPPVLDGNQTVILAPGEQAREHISATQLPPLPHLTEPAAGWQAAPQTPPPGNERPSWPPLSPGTTPSSVPTAQGAADRSVTPPPPAPRYTGMPAASLVATPAAKRGGNWPLLAGLAGAVVVLVAIISVGVWSQFGRQATPTPTTLPATRPPGTVVVTPSVAVAAASTAPGPGAAASATAAVAADPAREQIAAGDRALQEGRFTDAIARYKEALVVNPNSAGANRQLGHTLWVWNHDPGEVEFLDRATKLAPDDALAWAYLSYSAVDTHQGERALAAAQQAVRANPALPEAYAALANAYVSYPPNGADPESGKQEAQEALARAKALDANNLWVLWFESQVLQVQEQYDAAFVPLDRMIALRPNWPTLYYGKGTIFTAQKRYDDARALEERALALDPDYPYALTELAWLAYLDSDYPRAKSLFERALRLTDDVNDYAHRGLAFTLSVQGDYPNALLHCQRAAQIEPRRPAGYDCLGYISFVGLKRYDEANTAYRKVIELRPYLEDGYIGLARTAAAQNNYRLGETTLREALPQIQKPVYAYYWLGQMLYQQEKYQEAQPNFEQAAQKAPDDPNTFYWLGSNLERLQRWPEARAAYEQALKVDPKFQNARDALDRLQRQGH